MRMAEFFIGKAGDMSSKRLFCFILIVLFCIYFFANLFFGKVLKDSLEENLFYLIIVTFAGVASERISWKGKQGNISEQPPKP